MKRITLLIGLLLVAVGLPAQTQYILTKVNMGHTGSTWGAVVSNSGEVIFSGRGEERDVEGNLVSKLYMLSPNSTKPVSLFDKDSKEFPHMGAPYISPDGKELYFSVSGKIKIILSRGVFKTPEVYYPQQIAMSKRRSDGSWGAIELFQHNDEKHANGDPWLSNDGQYLYFTSDRPGGMGGLDIWRSKRNPNGSWAKPENMREINSSADERSPRFDKHGNFYYASNNGSLGGLDIFSCAILGDGHFTPAVRLAAPLNSSSDDFAITFIDDNNGYITSNRLGEDAIFQFEKFSAEEKTQFLIVDNKNNPLSFVQVYFMSEEACDSKFLTSDKNGRIETTLQPGLPYTMIMHKDSYQPKIINHEKSTYYQNRTISMEPFPECICPDTPTLPCVDPGDRVWLTGIHFDLNRWNIRPDAAREIDKLVTYMKENPTAEVEVSAYTDCRGSDAYNNFLSQKRANAVKGYLVRQGIASRRITAVGYGKTNLLNRCDCQATYCSEDEHQMNRRAEYKLTKQ